ncbi:hypothetical protein PS051_09030 [Escherichia albertii]|nr:hypothetical protein [Escherichia albertii]AHE61847.1 adenosylcobinamide-phosphate guanylyltransferase [Escherichia albertii KF1]WDB89944.1 hypothetical protein PS051_09030 [Escherichia albertii]
MECWQQRNGLIDVDINSQNAVLLECIMTMVTNLLFEYSRDTMARFRR